MASAAPESSNQSTTGGSSESMTQMFNRKLDDAKTFARARPFATATLAGVVGLAVLNTLRGKH